VYSVLEIETTHGETYRLMSDFDEWLEAFTDALAADHGVRLVESAPGQWNAERA
jgi:hypothetical protein